jgi:hypothetical protein
MNIEIITPETSDDSLTDGLRAITKAICEANPEAESGYGLGGRYGYGVEFENAVFEMHPFYWGECTCGFEVREEEWCNTHSHSAGCYQSELNAKRIETGLWSRGKYRFLESDKDAPYALIRKTEDAIYKEMTAKYNLPYQGCAVHCTCSYNKDFKEWRIVNDHDPRCPSVLPNFRHKDSGFEVRWYKWIGRDNFIIGECDWGSVLKDCMASI